MFQQAVERYFSTRQAISDLENRRCLLPHMGFGVMVTGMLKLCTLFDAKDDCQRFWHCRYLRQQHTTESLLD